MSAITRFLVAARLCDIPDGWIENERHWVSPDLYPGLLTTCGSYNTAADLIAHARAINALAYHMADDAADALKPLWDEVVALCPALGKEWIDFISYADI